MPLASATAGSALPRRLTSTQAAAGATSTGRAIRKVGNRVTPCDRRRRTTSASLLEHPLVLWRVVKFHLARRPSLPVGVIRALALHGATGRVAPRTLATLAAPAYVRLSDR